MACRSNFDMLNGACVNSEKHLLIKFGPECEEVKQQIKSKLSYFKKDVRKLLRKLRINSSAERPINLNGENGEHKYTMRVSYAADLLFSAEDDSLKCSWEEVPYIALEIERTKDSRKEVGDEDEKNINEIILERLSRIETAVIETPAKIHAIQKQSNSPKRNTSKIQSTPVPDAKNAPKPQNACGDTVTDTPVKSQQAKKPPTQTLANFNRNAEKAKSSTPAVKKVQEKSSDIALKHFEQIIDLVVSGMDDYSAEKYGSKDFVIEPPRRTVNEVSVQEFVNFMQALEHTESPFIETSHKKKRKHRASEACYADIDSANMTIGSSERHKKKKHRMSVNV